jgi:hypothetical protein
MLVIVVIAGADILEENLAAVHAVPPSSRQERIALQVYDHPAMSFHRLKSGFEIFVHQVAQLLRGHFFRQCSVAGDIREQTSDGRVTGLRDQQGIGRHTAWCLAVRIFLIPLIRRTSRQTAAPSKRT